MFHTLKTGRRYSTLLTSTSFFWHLTSSNLYAKFPDIFILPSCSRLRQLSCGTTVHCGEISLQYMQQRISELTFKKKVVVLIIDEVYTAQRVEYCNGKFIGLTENGSIAKTVLILWLIHLTFFRDIY